MVKWIVISRLTAVLLTTSLLSLNGHFAVAKPTTDFAVAKPTTDFAVAKPTTDYVKIEDSLKTPTLSFSDPAYAGNYSSSNFLISNKENLNRAKALDSNKRNKWEKESTQPLLSAEESKISDLKLFYGVMELIKEQYIDPKNDKELIDSAIAGMVSELDPHSSYLEPDEFKELTSSTEGKFGGLGIEITKEGSLIKVISPIDDTPAYKAGIMPEDYITHVGGESVVGLSVMDAVKKIRGEPGSEVELIIVRRDSPKPLNFKLKRAIINVVSVKSEIIADRFAYFRLVSFTNGIGTSLKQHLLKAQTKLGANLNGIIIDLRNNPGGLLDQAISVSDVFLSLGKTVVITKGRNDEIIYTGVSKEGDLSNEVPIVVLINSGSASASEIVAGALQDHARAVVIGTKSFGKGSVQNVIPLINGAALKMTVARYYTPNGRSIQATGIIPDVIVEQSKVESLETNNFIIAESQLPKHLSNDIMQNQDLSREERLSSLIYQNYKDDYQLAMALNILAALTITSNTR